MKPTMESDHPDKPSFSSGQRWMIFFSVVLSIVAMVAMVFMLNYLGARYYRRSEWSRDSRNQLSLQTIALLKTVTNQVNVTLYYDRADPLYSMVDAMLEEYQSKNPNLVVDKVDYLTDASKAQKIKATYKLNSPKDTNLIIFACEGRQRNVPGASLAEVSIEMRSSQGGTNEFVRHLKSFDGEPLFDSALLSVTSKNVRKAYFLQGHGEHLLESTATDGYQKFQSVLEGNNIEGAPLQLSGTNMIPTDCTLLVIAGPKRSIPVDELAKIRAYLNEGRHLFVMFNYYTVQAGITTGLESILEEWNVQVGNNVIVDPNNILSGESLWVHSFIPDHPLANPMFNGSGLAMINPRSIEAIQPGKAQTGAPEARGLAFVGPDSFANDKSQPPEKQSFSLIAVVEKGRPKGVSIERGTTAIVVAGDSDFLDNKNIDSKDNRDFAGFAVNWLMDQTMLLQGVGPKAVKEYRYELTHTQMRELRWIFMGAMPGSILFLGCIVWLRRRS